MKNMKTIRKESIQFTNLDDGREDIVALEDIISANKYIVHDPDPDISDEIRYEIEIDDEKYYEDCTYVDRKTYEYVAAYLTKQMIEKNKSLEEDK